MYIINFGALSAWWFIVVSAKIIMSLKIPTYWKNVDVIDGFYTHTFCIFRGSGSAVGIVTRYELDCPWIESRWEWDFSARLDWLWGPPSLLCNVYQVFPVVKLPGSGFDHPPQINGEVEERVGLYIWSKSSWPFLSRTLTLMFILIETLTPHEIYFCNHVYFSVIQSSV
jgi:hypothetical protein